MNANARAIGRLHVSGSLVLVDACTVYENLSITTADRHSSVVIGMLHLPVQVIAIN